ncbi:COPII-coated vesicle component Emp24 [Schizosaccharomyces japonicus yFS275]|uniref:COPII-coated vesicle component Emp24 n=1 Tax=Schizosaccharomyces japonicus (strain yFS275 / FY16936) TaxID=402676 RepID=B6K668_SCHJY|nr:COPII-coated vesicle component Emp24 [Schizosaccharomyces japonicus yFS275]EEB09022.1 COPII-coated vesicle component Emp24 [Schizosaccharomyces japonicus yFS275]
MLTKTRVLELLLALLFVSVVHAHSVIVKPQERRCLYEQLHKNDKMTVSYQTSVGGDQLVSMGVYRDDFNYPMFTQPGSSMGEYSFDAPEDAKYIYCFYNEGHDNQDKEVLFNVHGIIYVSADDPDNQNALEQKVKQLHDTIAQVRHEQEYLVARERVHRNTAESTNSRVKWWSILQAFLLVCVCVFQIFYVKRLFEVKRVV